LLYTARGVAVRSAPTAESGPVSRPALPAQRRRRGHASRV